MNKKQRSPLTEATASAIGERVKHYRAQRGDSMEELARNMGVSKETVRAIEAGEQTPREETMMRLELALGVTTEDLRPDDWRKDYAPGAWLRLISEDSKRDSRSSRTGKPAQQRRDKGKRRPGKGSSNARYREPTSDQRRSLTVAAVAAQ